MSMTYVKIRKRVAELLGIDSTDTTADNNDTIQDKLKEWVNLRYLSLCGKRSWNFLIKDAIVQTVADITTGTVTATNGSANLVFTSAIVPTSVAGYFIQFSDTTDWYELTSTADTTHAVMTVPYLGTTSSTLTFVIRKVYYALPSTMAKILNVSQHRIWNTSLKYIPPRLLDQYLAYRQATNRPRYYSIAGIDSSRQYKMQLFPTPNIAMNLNIRHYQVVTALSSDSDVPVIPEAFHEIIVWDVLSTYGYLFLDDTRISVAKAEFNDLFAQLKANDVASEGSPVRLAFDVDLSGFNNVLGQYNLPVQP